MVFIRSISTRDFNTCFRQQERKKIVMIQIYIYIYIIEREREREREMTYKYGFTYEPQRQKMYVLASVRNEDTNQPTLPRILIRVFVVRMTKLL